ncbi:hypothetical protein SLS57_011631 [Botryosphaeria dothidea]
MAASEIVVGIDFGTTYSGVSWAVNGGSKKVRLIDNWPNPKAANATHEKVPSVISYRDGRVRHWGYEVDQTADAFAFRWFKLLLDPGQKYGSNAVRPLQQSKKLLEALGKSAQDVVTDYLAQLWAWVQDDIGRYNGAHWTSIYSLKVVLTVPAIWSPLAKDNTERAAKAAGMPEDILLVTEPEAAALAVLKDTTSEMPGPQIQPGDAFVVCDAGGGTVDLISYEVKETQPLKIEECVPGNGDLCGSVFIDEGFEKWIRMTLGNKQFESINERYRARMFSEFEGVKRCFAGNDKEYSVDLIGVEENEEAGITGDTILLKPELLKTVFDHVCSQIVRHVESQIEEIKENNPNVKAVLLVGGFGASKYLHHRIESSCRGMHVQVYQVRGAGATLWGLENSSFLNSANRTIAARIARYSYGYCAGTRFDPLRHAIEDQYYNKRGELYARQQMFWFIQRQGDRIEEGKELTSPIYVSVQVSSFSRFHSSDTHPFTHALDYCADEKIPSRRGPSVKELCSVKFEIDDKKLAKEKSYKDPRTKEKWRDANFVLKVIPGNANLHFQVLYGGEVAESCEALYKEG